MANPTPASPLVSPRAALAVGLAGAALLLAAWFLPAMHNLGGRPFSSRELLEAVQSDQKASFFYAQLIAVPAALVALQPVVSLRWWGLAVAGVLGVAICLPQFGPMGDAPSRVLTPFTVGIAATAAAALVVAAGRRQSAARWVAWIGAVLVFCGLVIPSSRVDQMFPGELASLARRLHIEDGAPMTVLLAGFGDGGGSALLSAAALLAPTLAGAAAFLTSLVDERPRLAERAALVLLLYLPIASALCCVASLFPGSRYEWDLGVRARYALTASTFWVWAILGVAGGVIALRRRAAAPSPPPPPPGT